MKNISDLIPIDTAFVMTLDSDATSEAAEGWEARLVEVIDDEDEGDFVRRGTLATARLYRVHFEEPDWLDDLDAEDEDVYTVGTAFEDVERFAEIDPDSAFAPALVVVDQVEVLEHARGRKLSHALIRAITSVFRHDHIALLPAGLSIDGDGERVEDPTKRAALIRHWRACGFQSLPDSEVMWLPFRGRD